MRLHVHEWGDADAPALICLHGVSAHGRRFRRLAEERLAKRFRVLAPDLRGHGRSGYEPPWNIATHLADVLETVDEIGVEQPARGSATASADGSCWSCARSRRSGSRAQCSSTRRSRSFRTSASTSPRTRREITRSRLPRRRSRRGWRAASRRARASSWRRRRGSTWSLPRTGSFAGGSRAPRPRPSTASSAPSRRRLRRCARRRCSSMRRSSGSSARSSWRVRRRARPAARGRCGAGRAHRLLGCVRGDRGRRREVPDS